MDVPLAEQPKRLTAKSKASDDTAYVKIATALLGQK
jgi:hypothetical protein